MDSESKESHTRQVAVKIVALDACENKILHQIREAARLLSKERENRIIH